MAQVIIVLMVPWEKSVSKLLKAIASKDCKSVFLAIPGMKLVEQMAVEYQLKGKNDEKKSAVYFSVSNFKDLAEGQFAYEITQKLNLGKAIEDKSQTLKASVALGKTLLNKYGCIACHSLDGSKLGKIGPTFKGMYGSVRHFNKGKSQSADTSLSKNLLLNQIKKSLKVIK